MKSEENHLIPRAALQECGNKHGFEWTVDGNVFPDNKRYSTIFMTAQRGRLSWVYNSDEDVPEQARREMGIGWCVRSDALPKAGSSNRHLVAFEMFGTSGIIREDDAIASSVDAVMAATDVNVDHLSAVTSQENLTANHTLRELGVRVAHQDTSFGRPDTNRSGHRVELKVDFHTKGQKQSWEVQNLIVLTRVGVQQLRQPIVDGGGSFERLVAIREEVPDVFETSTVIPVVNRAKILVPENADPRQAEALADIARTATVMAQSGYEVGKETRQQQTFRKVVRELGLKGLRLGVTDDQLLELLEFTKKHINNWGVYDGQFPSIQKPFKESGLVKMIGTMYETYETMVARLKTANGLSQDVQKLAVSLSKKYDGGTENGISQIALDRLNS
jgi:alanyl-tRNA synthetase